MATFVLLTLELRGNQMEIFKESSVQKEKFRIAANKLLNQCFILKKKEDTRSDYVFILQNKQYFQEYFELLGYQIEMNENQGVIALMNANGTGRLHLKKSESILLLIFRLLYIEKRKELSLNEETVIIMEEMHQKYNMLKIDAKATIDKTTLRDTIRLFKRYQLVQPLDADVTVLECRLKLYPSLLFAVTNEDINAYYEEMQEKIKKYMKGGTNNDEEDFDQDQAD